MSVSVPGAADQKIKQDTTALQKTGHISFTLKT